MTERDGSRFRALAVVLRVFAVFAVATGALDIVVGTRLLIDSGAVIPPGTAVDPVLNSQIKFFGAVWCGYGSALWWTAGDLRARAPMLRILLGTLFIGGIGRLLSAMLFGLGSTMLVAFIAIELAGLVAVLAWHRKRLGSEEKPQSQ